MPDGVPGAGGMELGYRLKRDAWGHGYATEAAHATVATTFDGIGLDEIWSITAVLNTPSQAVMRRAGLTFHGHFEHPRIAVGSPIRAHVAYRRERPT